jgi:HSP20 family protein
MELVRRNRGNLSPWYGWGLGNVSDPFDFSRLFSQTALPTFGQLAQASYPLDLYETEESIVLEMAVPGVRVEDLDISIEGRQLSIQGTLPEAEEAEGRRYWLQSIPRGRFTRTLALPVAVEADNIQAHAHDGLLVLTMPKVAEARARKIAINQ